MYKKIIMLIVAVTSFTFAQNNFKPQKEKLDTLLSGPFFNRTMLALDVLDLTTGDTLYKQNEQMLLHPASNMKVLTTSAGLLFLGPDYRFKTSLYYTGKIINNTLYGDLYVVGGCDPDFTTPDLDSLVNMIQSAGIREITGNLYGDVSMTDSLFWGKGWMWDDDPSTDAPYLTALNINDNAVNIHYKPGKVGYPAEIWTDPSSPYFTVDNSSVTVKGDSSDFKVGRDWVRRSNRIFAKGCLPESAGEDSTRINLFDPQNYFLELFKEKIDASPVRFAGEIDTSAAPESAVYLNSMGRRYDTVIVNLNKTSDNLSAEMTLRAMAAKYFGKPATAENGIKLTDSLLVLSGLDPSVYRIVDGSGVSHYNLVTAKSLLSVLAYMYSKHPDLYKILYHSFPIAGIDGTLEKRMNGSFADHNAHAKTGTLSGVSCLSGYVTAKNGHLLSFSIMVQNHVRNTKTAKGYEDKIVEIIADYD